MVTVQSAVHQQFPWTLTLQELYSHYTQQVKDTCASLADPHKAYLLRKAVHYFNTQRQHRQEAQDKPLIEV